MWGVAPECFQIVAFAEVLAHDVDNHVKVIEDYPGGLKRSVHSPRANPVFLPQTIVDFFHDGPQVRFADARGDHEIIGHRRDFPDIQDGDVLRLFLVRQFPAALGKFTCIHRS